MSADRIEPLAFPRLAGRDPVEVVETVYHRIAARGTDGVWIHLAGRDEAALVALGGAFHRAAAPPLGASAAGPPERTG